MSGGRSTSVRVAALSVAVVVAAVATGAWWLSRPFVDPAQSGFGVPLQPGPHLDDSVREQLDDVLDEAGVDAFVAVRDSEVVASRGDTDRVLNVASVRKSLLSALVGIAVDRGLLDLDATLAELGIDEPAAPLTETERSATVRDLLTARSGVYLPALGETEIMRERRPARGSHDPGSYFYYSNWDFNALGTILEQETGLDLGQAFTEWIARPTGMEHVTPANVTYEEAGFTVHRMYRFHLSASDLARFGALYAQEGRFGGVQVIPRWWVEESLTPYSPVAYAEPASSYGYLWWLGDDSGYARAEGYGGQYVLVDRSADLATVVLNDTGRSILGYLRYELLDRRVPLDVAVATHETVRAGLRPRRRRPAGTGPGERAGPT